MNTKLTLAIAAIALVAAALVGVTAAQFANTNTTNPNLQQALPPCTTGNQTVPPSCLNATTGEQYCYENGTYTGNNCDDTCTANCNQTRAGYCWNNTDTDASQNQNQYCNENSYGCTDLNQNQNGYGYGAGKTERNSDYGWGCHR